MGSIVAAALALPGVASAETAPEQGEVALKFLHYQDQQPGLERVTVNAPSLYVLAPLSAHWSLQGSLVHDAVSGASPRSHADISSASVMHDERTAGDLKLTRYFDRTVVSVGVALSNEHDYRSKAFSLEARQSSSDNNTTWNLGLGLTHDDINPVNQVVVDEKRKTTELSAGVTQAWSANDLVQANLTLGSGSGYFNDPYKVDDARPRARRQQALLLSWNHHVPGWGGTLRSSYRLYHDSFNVQSHTLEATWVQPLNERFTLSPTLRYYTQRAASFYVDPGADLTGATYYSTDTRLSAFGAITLGAKLAWKIDKRWSADVALNHYQQRAGWRIGGAASAETASLSANWLQLGVKSTF